MEQDVVVNLYMNLIQAYKLATIGFIVIIITMTVVRGFASNRAQSSSAVSNRNTNPERKREILQEKPNKEKKSVKKEVTPEYLLSLFEKACSKLSVEQIKSMVSIWEDMAKNLFFYNKLSKEDKYEVKKAVTYHLPKLVESFVESGGEFDKFVDALKEIAEFIKIKTLAVKEQSGDFQTVYKFIKERY